MFNAGYGFLRGFILEFVRFAVQIVIRTMKDTVISVRFIKIKLGSVIFEMFYTN